MTESSLPSKNDTVPVPPAGYPELSGFGPILFDGSNPYAWGFKILRHLGEDRFNDLGKYGKLICLDFGSWALVVKWLTPEEAVEQYGPITHQKFGPNGGWKSVRYGETTFTSTELKPSCELEAKFTFEKEVLHKKGTKKSDYTYVFFQLKMLRSDSKCSKEKFAKLLGVTEKTITEWESYPK